MKNEELVRINTAIIEDMVRGDYLNKEFYDKSVERKNRTIKNLRLQREHLLKYKRDFMAYFRKDYLYQCKRKEYPFGLSRSCAFLGILGTIMYFLYFHDGYNPIALAIGASVIILPTIYERIILPIYHSHKRYREYLNTIDTKLEIIKEYKREFEDEDNYEEEKSLEGVDSFIKLIISYNNELDGLKEEDQQRIKIELVKLSKDYMEYIVTRSKNKGISLETNEEMVKFNKRLNEIELEINELKKITSEQEINETAIEEAFGVDITKLDTSIVELNPNITGPELKRILK